MQVQLIIFNNNFVDLQMCQRGSQLEVAILKFNSCSQYHAVHRGTSMVMHAECTIRTDCSNGSVIV